MKHHPLAFVLGLALALPLAGAALAQAHDHAGHTTSAPAEAATLTEGEVRKIDKPAGKITLKHGAIKNLDMEPMTMVFRVSDAAMLDQVKVGDKVSFVAEKVGGMLTVTRIAPAQ